jgi:hypothetical protein
MEKYIPESAVREALERAFSAGYEAGIPDPDDEGWRNGSEPEHPPTAILRNLLAAGWLHGWPGRSDAFTQGFEEGRRIWKPDAGEGVVTDVFDEARNAIEAATRPTDESKEPRHD